MLILELNPNQILFYFFFYWKLIILFSLIPNKISLFTEQTMEMSP